MKKLLKTSLLCLSVFSFIACNNPFKDEIDKLKEQIKDLQETLNSEDLDDEEENDELNKEGEIVELSIYSYELVEKVKDFNSKDTYHLKIKNDLGCYDTLVTCLKNPKISVILDLSDVTIEPYLKHTDGIFESDNYGSASNFPIKKGVFADCTSIVKVIYPKKNVNLGNAAFYGCTRLKDVVISDAYTEIKSYEFSNSGIVSISLPESIRYIREYAFNGCLNLKNITLPSFLEEIGSGAFSSCIRVEEISIPSSVNHIGWAAFRECTSLETVNCAGNIDGGNGTLFVNCVNLKTVNITSKIESIPYFSFYNCKSLSNFIIPDTVKSIGIRSFYNTNIQTITIPKAVEYIDSQTFSGCKVIIEDGNENFITSDDNTLLFKKDENNEIILIYASKDNSKIVVPENTEKIGQYAIDGNFGITNVQIPATVKNIEEFSFVNGVKVHISAENSVYASTEDGDYLYTKDGSLIYTNSKLQKLEIPSEVLKMENNCVYENSNITTIVVPEGVTEISDSAISDCCNLKEIVLPKSLSSYNDCIRNCPKFKYIRYRGSESEWIEKFGEYWSNNTLTFDYEN